MFHGSLLTAKSMLKFSDVLNFGTILQDSRNQKFWESRRF